MACLSAVFGFDRGIQHLILPCSSRDNTLTRTTKYVWKHKYTTNNKKNKNNNNDNTHSVRWQAHDAPVTGVSVCPPSRFTTDSQTYIQQVFKRRCIDRCGPAFETEGGEGEGGKAFPDHIHLQHPATPTPPTPPAPPSSSLLITHHTSCFVFFGL